MCGYDLRREPSRKRQISWVDALLVLAVLLVLFFWWQAGNRQANDDELPAAVGLPADQIPFLPPTPTATPTPVATALPAATPAQPSGTIEHAVVQGETLLSIALDYGVTVEDIQRVNSLSGDLIRPGDKLTIPNQQAVLAPPASASEAPRGPISTFAYIVQNGDTIISIASRLGSTVDEILTANNLTASDLIRPGDTLNIPVRQVPPEVLSSTVQGGEAQGAVYSAPQSVAPADGATVARTEPVLLRWASVGLLQLDEWYVVLLYPQSPDAAPVPQHVDQGDQLPDRSRIRAGAGHKRRLLLAGLDRAGAVEPQWRLCAGACKPHQRTQTIHLGIRQPRVATCGGPWAASCAPPAAHSQG